MEIWDLYNENREVIGEHIRCEKLPENAYHLVVHIWIRRSDGKFLISQRSADRKQFPLMWETVGGSVLKGESSLEGAVREVKEEVGIDLHPAEGTLAFSRIRKTVGGKPFNDILDVWVFPYDGEVSLDRATTNEVAQVKWLDSSEINRMLENGTMVQTLHYFSKAISPEIQWLFFDIGSTLVDESACYEKRYRETTDGTGISYQTFKDKVIQLAATSDNPYKQAVAFFGLHKTEWHKELEQPYPFTEGVLQTLSERYHLGIIANQSAGSAQRLADWGIGRYFDLVLASAEAGVEKPNPAIFEMALRRAGCLPENAVMVGDRLDNDILPAKQLGMKTVWVKQGFAAYQSASDIPDNTVNSLMEITNLY